MIHSRLPDHNSVLSTNGAVDGYKVLHSVRQLVAALCVILCPGEPAETLSVWRVFAFHSQITEGDTR